MVVNELRGEKVDIVPYTDDAAEFVQKALAPARVREVRIHEDTGTAEVIVPDFQLSLAIGKEGQNARLAARLSGWRVDIKSETQLQEEEGGEVDYAEGEWVQNDSGELVFQPAGGGDSDLGGRGGLRVARPAPRATPRPPRATTPRTATQPAEARGGRGRGRRRRPTARPRRRTQRGPARTVSPRRSERPRTGYPRPQRATQKRRMHDERPAPVRTCVGCRRRAAPHELVRVRSGADRQLEVGAGDRAGVRGCAGRPADSNASTPLRSGARSHGRCGPAFPPKRSRSCARLVGHHDAPARRDGPVDDETQDGTSH